MRDDEKLTGRAKRRKKTSDAVAAPAAVGDGEGVQRAAVTEAAARPVSPRSASRKAPVIEFDRASGASEERERAGRPKADQARNDREAVLSANSMFYRAFEVRDLELMGQLWANTPYVRCIHPGWEPLFGWEEVVGSWGQIFSGMETLRFSLADVSVRVGGDMAWVELSEILEATHEGKPARSQVLATNLFERGVDGRWRLIHHHASPIMVRQAAPRRGGPSLH